MNCPCHLPPFLPHTKERKTKKGGRKKKPPATSSHPCPSPEIQWKGGEKFLEEREEDVRDIVGRLPALSYHPFPLP